jgi:hypothetical protein
MRHDSFLAHRSRCSRQHFIAATTAIAAGSILAGCGESSGVTPSGVGSAVEFGARSSPPIGRPSANQSPVPIPANPIAGGLHFQKAILPGKGDELSTIYDFNGGIGRAGVHGTGTGNGAELFWAADFAFMEGEFRSAAGSFFHGAFAFV